MGYPPSASAILPLPPSPHLPRWLYEGLSREKAEELLLLPGNCGGAFIIRESQTRRGGCSPVVLDPQGGVPFHSAGSPYQPRVPAPPCQPGVLLCRLRSGLVGFSEISCALKGRTRSLQETGFSPMGIRKAMCVCVSVCVDWGQLRLPTSDSLHVGVSALTYRGQQVYR